MKIKLTKNIFDKAVFKNTLSISNKNINNSKNITNKNDCNLKDNINNNYQSKKIKTNNYFYNEIDNQTLPNNYYLLFSK